MGEQLDYSFQHYGDFGWSFLFLVPLLIIVVLVLYVIIYLINIGVKNKLLKRGLITILLISLVIPFLRLGLVKSHNRDGSITIPKFQKKLLSLRQKTCLKMK